MLRLADVAKVIVVANIPRFGRCRLAALRRPCLNVARLVAIVFPFVARTEAILVYALGYRYFGLGEGTRTVSAPDPGTDVYRSLVT